MKQGMLEGIATTALRRSATNILTKALTRLIEPAKEPKHLVKKVVQEVHPLYYVNTVSGFLHIDTTPNVTQHAVKLTKDMRSATPFKSFAEADAAGGHYTVLLCGRKRQYYAVIQPSYG